MQHLNVNPLEREYIMFKSIIVFILMLLILCSCQDTSTPKGACVFVTDSVNICYQNESRGTCSEAVKNTSTFYSYGFYEDTTCTDAGCGNHLTGNMYNCI